MFETVTVDEALNKAQRNINLPAILFFFIPIGVSIFFTVQYKVSPWVIAAGVVAGILLAWLYWGVMITRWRLWAFENVRNVHELKKRAIKEKLIWPDGSIWQKTEIRSAADKEKWSALQWKFKQDDIFNDDLTVGAETLIYYSKGKAYGEMAFGVAMLGGGIYFYLDNGTKIWLPIILVVVGVFLLVSGYKHLNNPNPQISLSNEGMATADTEFYSWADIDNEDTVVVSRGKSSTTYLRYNSPKGEVEIDIDELAIAKRKLDALLRLYRGRYEQKMKRQQVLN